MPIDARIDAWAVLALKALPSRAMVEVLRAFGGPLETLVATRAELAARLPPALVLRVLAPVADDALAATRAWLADSRHELIAWDDPNYPQQLLDLPDAPPVLYLVGRRDLLARTSIAIVGSRHATPQGVDNAEAFASVLSAAGLTIVSGLALGIDTAAHRGALDHAGSTIAVIGTGPDRVYPARNRDLAHAIAERGAIVSEFAPGTPPRKEHFPRRNRLLSGLARGVLVVEATLSSGSLITARLAGEQGRDVFAVPGSIHSPFSKGPHKLIREGAKLVETAQDVLEDLGLASPARADADDTGSAGDDDTGPHAAVLRAMGHDPVDLDQLIARTSMTAQNLAAALTTLELDGRVAAQAGGRWQRAGARARWRTRTRA
ncbi:MAG TPA: DNA-processing protein DprA [Casimicrobiaceae bacterium]|nr:DNA-processing protein DprA [Casimicrobiaceae bacterium]